MSQANFEQDLIDLNQQLGEAEKTKNEAFLRSILSEALRFRRANGTIIDKAIYLDDLTKPGNTTDQLTSDDIAVQFYEDNIAIATLKVHTQGMRCGRELNGTFRNVRIFHKEPDKHPHWQLHFWFNERIP